ncbi:MAG: four helix bundle protein [Candidatus Sulfotelmatobacter sp.]
MSYRDLIAWKTGMQLVGAIYDATDTFPQHEIYGLTSQLRRAAVSIPSNIAEGQAHYTNPEFIRFLRHARGSLAEIETQILISKDRGYLREEQADKLIGQAEELGRVLSGLINSMKKVEEDRR